jgi:quercetin dioxygenase-like cupin family protein
MSVSAYTIRGTGRAICGGKEFALTPGTTLRVPAGVPHGATFDAGWEGLEIGLADPARSASAA